MSTLMIDTTTQQIASAGGTPAPVFIWAELTDGSRKNTGEQQRDDQHRQIWQVTVIIPPVEDNDAPEMIKVQVAAHDEPQTGPLGTPLEFDRLRVRPTVNRRSGQLALYWSADGVRPRSAKVHAA